MIKFNLNIKPICLLCGTGVQLMNLWTTFLSHVISRQLLFWDVASLFLRIDDHSPATMVVAYCKNSFCLHVCTVSGKNATTVCMLLSSRFFSVSQIVQRIKALVRDRVFTH